MGTYVEKKEEKKEINPASRPIGRVNTSKFEQAASSEQESKPLKKPIGRVDTSKFEQSNTSEQ